MFKVAPRTPVFLETCALERFKVAPVDGRVKEQASGEGIHPGLNSAESSEKCLRGLGELDDKVVVGGPQV